MSNFDAQRDSVLNGIVVWRLLNEYIMTQSPEVWDSFQVFMNDLKGGDFEALLGMVNLSSVLLASLTLLTDKSPHEILAAIGERTAVAEENGG